MMIFATFLISVLCGMGLGSGGIYIVYLTVFAGFEQLYAQGLNLYFFIFSTASALIIHIKNQKLHPERLTYICALGSLGCIGGALLAQNLDSGILRNIFAILLIVSGCISLFTKNEKSSHEKRRNF